MLEEEKRPKSEALEREMAISRAEFRRSLLPLISEMNPAETDSGFYASPAPEQELHIELSDEYEHRIASLSLPMVRVKMRFKGFSDQQRLTFLHNFELAFQRGGG